MLPPPMTDRLSRLDRIELRVRLCSMVGWGDGGGSGDSETVPVS